MKVETTVLIPNYNGKEHLKECLTSLRKQSYSKFKVILLDNNSTDSSSQYVKNNFPEVDVLSFDKNHGAIVNNKGIEYSLRKYRPKYISILNNDTKTDKDWLKHLVQSIEAEKRIAAVASNMLFYDNPDMINSQGCTCTSIGDGYDINMNRKLEDSLENHSEVLYASTGAILIKASALRKIGVFDDRYFIYSEDLDWGWRANMLGYKIIFSEKAMVYHKGSAYWKHKPLKKEYLCKRNALSTIIKNYELRTLLKISPRLFWNYATYPIWVFISKNVHPGERIRFALIPLKSASWNIINLKTTLKLRTKVQNARKAGDSEIMRLVMK